MWQHKAKVLNQVSQKESKIELPSGHVPSLQQMKSQAKPPTSLPPNFIHSWETTNDPPNPPVQNEPTTNSVSTSDLQSSQAPHITTDTLSHNIRTRSGQISIPPKRLTYASICSHLETFSPQPLNSHVQHLLQPDVESLSEPHPFALVSKYIIGLTSSDPDTMYLHEALQQPDRDKFI